MLSWVQGTIFGAPVVPPVNMISASSGRNPSGPAVTGDGARALSRWTAMGPADSEIGQNGEGRLGVVQVTVDQHNPRPCGGNPGLLVGDGQGGVQRDDDEARARSRQQSDDELGTARCPQADPVAGEQAARGQLFGQLVDQPVKLAVADREALRGDDQRGFLRVATCRRREQIGDPWAGVGVVGSHRSHSFLGAKPGLTCTMPGCRAAVQYRSANA